MSDTCPKCGLPMPICVCETIAKESQRIRIYLVKKKFDKFSTIVEGLEAKSIDIRDVARKLKSDLACGGTSKEGKIELQGDHRQKARNSLVKMGFGTNTIEVR
ncbi:TPA: translation initiation factor [Candidatus Woesearchaeota archaeon]|nr:translation initiation factor [Candidatus Woesearchaeota archaeon]